VPGGVQVPVDALRRLHAEEFLAWARALPDGPAPAAPHRDAVRAVSAAVWARVPAKAGCKDELHANSVYIALRHDVDGHSLDCFGATLCTIAGLAALGRASWLTLSEDHAYESHPLAGGAAGVGTCEIAVPGSNKEALMRRGREIAEVMREKSRIAPETSWMYMHTNAVVCRTVPMAIAAAAANINCDVRKGGGEQLVAAQLLELKAALLWALRDAGHLARFPCARPPLHGVLPPPWHPVF
jgi:hypothetical protein